MNISLLNKVALIGGSSQGIGFATAKELAENGATCILMGRNETALQQAVLQLVNTNNQVHTYFVVDFDKPAEVQQTVQQITSAYSIDILINNSGGPNAGPIQTANTDEFLLAFNRHLIGNHICTQAVIAGMKKNNYGRIINIISTSVKVPLPNLGVSNTIRGAVASWAKTMANELGQFNITVNNVLPGATLTKRLENIIANNANKKQINPNEVKHEMEHEIPMKRFADASEIANVVAFLASPAASYVNGVSIPVDGGRTGSI